MLASEGYFEKLARVTHLRVGMNIPKPRQCASTVVGSALIYVQGLVDLAEERQRLGKSLVQREAFLLRVQKKLQNEKFINRAPANVVERERQKEQDAKAEIEQLKTSLAAWMEA